MNFHGAKKLLQMVSNDLWAWYPWDILSNQRLTRDDKHVPVDSP